MKPIIHASVVTVVSFIGLTGFIFGNPEADVSKFISETQSRLKVSHKVNLPPLPEYHENQPFQYSAGNADPFKLKSFVTDVASNPEEQPCNSADCGDGPPVVHTPYFLEGYDLTTLRMVGTMNSPKNQMAVLIATPDSGVQEAHVGEYIGRNNGLILSIQPDHVLIQEKYKVPRGWQNRMASLELFN